MSAANILDFEMIRACTIKEAKSINHKSFISYVLDAPIQRMASALINFLVSRLNKKVREHEIFIRGISAKVAQMMVGVKHGDVGDNWSMEEALDLLLENKSKVKAIRAKICKDIDAGKTCEIVLQAKKDLVVSLASLYEALDELHINLAEFEASIAPIEDLSISSQNDIQSYLDQLSA